MNASELSEPTPYAEIPPGVCFKDYWMDEWVKQHNGFCRNPDSGPATLPVDEIMFPTHWSRRKIKKHK